MIELIKRKQLAALLLSHTKEILREPAVLFWGIVFPILMALGLGIAFTQSRDIVRNVAVIEAPSLSSQNGRISTFEKFLKEKTKRIEGKEISNEQYELRLNDKKLGNTIYYFQKTNWNDATVLLKRGEISLIIEEKNGNIEYHFDPINSEAQITYLNLSKIITSSLLAGKKGLNKRLIEKDDYESAENRVEPLTLQGTRYIDFLVPGLISMGIMMSSVWGLSYGMIERRSKKLLRRMVATPMKKSHFLISLIAVRTVMNFIEASLLFSVAYLVFHVTIQGSLIALFLIFISSNTAFAGIAILTSSRTGNTEVGNGLINAVTTPMIVLSGIFFSYHNFPDWALPFIKILPLTILADGVRSIFIEGAGFQEIALPFIILFSMGIIFFLIGLRIFKWY